jgi:hypothetical protein
VLIAGGWNRRLRSCGPARDGHDGHDGVQGGYEPSTSTRYPELRHGAPLPAHRRSLATADGTG